MNERCIYACVAPVTFLTLYAQDKLRGWGDILVQKEGEQLTQYVLGHKLVLLFSVTF